MSSEASVHCIGLIGGMSWESTAVYYRRINERVRDLLGGLHSADIILRSVDFDRITRMQKAGEWGLAEDEMSSIAIQLERAGAEVVLICTNTMHLTADAVQSAIGKPLLHIADVTGEAIAAAGVKRPLLLATRYTMEHAFYRSRLSALFGVDTMVPDEDDRGTVHEIIFDELCKGVIRDDSRRKYQAIINRALAAGADSVILGCTEIGLLIGETDVECPVFDTTMLHADAAVDYVLRQPSAGH